APAGIALQLRQPGASLRSQPGRIDDQRRNPDDPENENGHEHRWSAPPADRLRLPTVTLGTKRTRLYVWPLLAGWVCAGAPGSATCAATSPRSPATYWMSWLGLAASHCTSSNPAHRGSASRAARFGTRLITPAAEA